MSESKAASGTPDRMLYESRYAEPLPKRHSGPLRERVLGAWTDPRDAYEAVEWVRVMNSGLAGLRWHARVETRPGLSASSLSHG